jgi:hypothetical protein
MSLRKGKKSRDDAGISRSNILDKRRNEKRVSFDKVPEATFDENSTIMAPGTSNRVEKGLSEIGKISNNYFDADKDDVSTHTPLPRTKEEFDKRSEEFKNHPVWDLLSRTEYYDVTKHWDWTPESGHTPTDEMWAKEWDNLANIEEEQETTFGYINREIRRRRAESFPKVPSKSGKIGPF